MPLALPGLAVRHLFDQPGAGELAQPSRGGGLGHVDRVTPLAGVTFAHLDVTDPTSVSSLVDRLITEHGRLDVLVNNAGFGLIATAEQSSVAQVRDLFEINVFGMLRITQAVLPQMRAHGRGRVSNISPVLGLMPSPSMAAYSTSKHAVEGYSESMDHELREHGVRVVLVEPAFTGTDFEANAGEADFTLEVYDAQRARSRQPNVDGVEHCDDPSVVAQVVVTAATADSPRVHYTAGKTARQVSLGRRLAPARCSTSRSAS